MQIEINPMVRNVSFASCISLIAILSVLDHEHVSPRFSAIQEEKAYSQTDLHEEFSKGYICRSCGVSRVHAATLAHSRNGGILAFWWGGSREGGKDVSIFMSHQNEKRAWSKPKTIFDISQVKAALGRYTKKLGNVAAIVDKNNRLWLFFVSVSAGGWSGSSLNYTLSADGGKTWTSPKKIVSSPFFNVSTLVRNQPFLYEDGTIGIPVYHELVGKFSEILRIGLNGRIIEKQRLTWGRHSLQPSLIIDSGTAAMALHRQHNTSHRKIIVTRTNNAGASWKKEGRLNLPNPDASVAALKARDGNYLLVFNNLEFGRRGLSIAVSMDKGESWKVIHELEQENDAISSEDEYSYPSLIQTPDQQFHIAYTWKRQAIAYASFSPNWVSRKLSSVDVVN